MREKGSYWPLESSIHPFNQPISIFFHYMILNPTLYMRPFLLTLPSKGTKK